MTTADSWLAPAQAHAEPEERVGYTFHYRHCQCNCHLEVHGSRRAHGSGRAERMARQTQRDHLPEGYFRDSAYVPAKSACRSLLKRVGERGAGEFVEITWDEGARHHRREGEEIPGNTDREPSPSKRPSTRSPPSFPSCSRGGKPHRGIDIGLGNGFSGARRSGQQGASSNEVDPLEERQDHPERGMQHAGDVHGNRALLLRGEGGGSRDDHARSQLLHDRREELAMDSLGRRNRSGSLPGHDLDYLGQRVVQRPVSESQHEHAVPRETIGWIAVAEEPR